MTHKPKFPKHPKYPERICWGCHHLCAQHNMQCGNGSDRTQHPIELMGDDWFDSLSEEEKLKIDWV